MSERQVAISNALSDGVAKVCAGHVTDYLVRRENRLATHDNMRRIIQRKAAQFALDTFGADALQRGAPMKVALIQSHGETKSGFVGIVFMVNVCAPEPVALFQAQRIKGPTTRRDDAQRPPCFPECVP